LTSGLLKNLQMPDSVETAKDYYSQYKGSPAEAYMESRGLAEVAERFRIGYVGSARVGHEYLTGRLAIPYLRPAGGLHAVATIRYRCIQPHDCKAHGGDKMLSMPGDRSRLFNTQPLILESDIVVLTEGEFDAMAWTLADVPAIGYQGVNGWRPHFTTALIGFKTVFIVADDDPPGIKAAKARAEELPNGQIINLGGGHDSNSYLQMYGIEALRKGIGL